MINTTTSSFVIISSSFIFISSRWSSITVFLGTSYSSLIAFNSFFIIYFKASSSVNILLYVSIFKFKSFNSSSSKVISVLVKRYNCKVTIASACSIVKSNSLTKFSLASLLFLLALITRITSSSILIAFIKPSTIWKRSLAWSKSNLVRLVSTSFKWSI